MAALIPESKIDEVRIAADIVEIISGYVPLKRRGRNFIALCPFHNEKTPSFTVSPDKQIYHCFGCGKGGNVFTFLMEHEKITFVESVTLLAERYGIVLPRYRREEDAKTERLQYANQVAAEFFQACAKNARYREKIERYLYQTRGLSSETVEQFQIGLAPEDWDGLLKYAQKKDLSPQELEKAGLAIKSEKTGEYFDRFRLRLMFPIFNLSGKVVAFGGRALKKGESAKYMNSPETLVYDKSNILYGLNFSRGAIRETESAILVEGYFDFLSLYQAGLHNVAAVSGTAFTKQQARLLARFARKAYLFFDADSAGRSAALRSVEHFFNAGIEPIITTPPPKTDPDSYVREFGPEGVLKLLDKGLPYLAFRFEGMDFNAMTMREKEQVVREIRSLVGGIDEPIRRDIFISSAAAMMKLPANDFKPGRPDSKTTPKIPERSRNLNVIESEFLSLFLGQPLLIELAWDEISPDDFEGPGHGAIYARMIESYRNSGQIHPDRIIEEISDETEKSALSLIATIEWGDVDPAGVVREYKRMILNQKRQALLANLKERLKAAEEAGDRELAVKLTDEMKYLLVKEK
jgi:DNA primase